MDQNPLIAVAERAKQVQLENSISELLAEMKKVNERLTEIEELLKSQTTAPDKTYIK
jgi:hypothetical protein